MTDDPGRWLDQDDLDPELRSALRAGKHEAPSEAQLASLAARLGPLMGPPGGSGGGGADGGASGGGAGAAATKGGVSLAAKAMGGLMTAIAVTSVGLFMAAPDQVESPALRTHASTAEAASTPEAEPEPEPEPEPEVIPEGVDAPEPEPEPEPAAPRRATLEDDPAAELALIREAQAALASSPAVALEHTAAHRRRFGDGTLAQEREVVAIDALVRLGREAAAHSRATRFRSRWPRSAHVRRIDVLAPP